MTDEEINIAIAQVCEFTHIRKEVKPVITYVWGTKDGEEHIISNYCNDLNAMHEAVNILNEEQKEKYFFNLMCVFGNWPKAIQANAKQRAEALLRVFGKWKD
jgi:hypothetical protein